MAFVPVVTPPTQPVSPRVRELTAILGKVLDEYRKSHPSVTDAEVRAALRMVAASGSATAAKIAVLVGVLVAMVAIVAFSLFMAEGGSGGGSGSPATFSMVIAGLVVFLGLVMVIIKAKSG